MGDWVSVTERAADLPEAEAAKELVKIAGEPQPNVTKEVEMVG